MKKLMIAAALCAAVSGLQSIESSNIVGYQNKDVRANLSVQLPTFDGVSATGVDIQTIKPAVADGETLESGDFTIQIYGDTGIIESSWMYWFGADVDAVYEKEGSVDGWYDEDGTLVSKTFDLGEAFTVCASKTGTLLYNGQVVKAQVVVPVRQNLSCQGNFRPTGVDVQTVKPAVGDGETLESGDFTIQIYGDTGIIESSWMYMFGADVDAIYEKEGSVDGWYDEDGTLVTKTFDAGEGFNVCASKAGTLTFPALSL